uniref:L1 transposable element RRM domain-containing protein n=1 Tax=Neolamprologus brichardi TaxID=32507 RepID=A0A3Q4HZB5_NEOBR
MSRKPGKQINSSSRIMTSANAEPYCSHWRLWEKISNKILRHINKRFDNLEHTLHAVQKSQRELLEKGKSMEEQALDQENRLSRLEKVVSNLESRNKALTLKGPRPAEFTQDLIPKLLGEDHLKSPVIVDRAHRSPRSPPAAGAAPRPIIARIHFYRDKELILRLQRDRALEYQGHKVLIFPEVRQQRREFSEVFKILREKKMELRYPAKLLVKYNGHLKVFSTLGEVSVFINSELNSLSLKRSCRALKLTRNHRTTARTEGTHQVSPNSP